MKEYRTAYVYVNFTLSNIWDFTKHNFKFERKAFSNALKEISEGSMFWGIFGNYSLNIFIIEYKITSAYIYRVDTKIVSSLFRYIFFVYPVVALVTTKVWHTL